MVIIQAMNTIGDSGFAPFSLWAFLTGTLIYAFQEFYVVLHNVNKFDDGRTGYLNCGYWNNGSSTVNPHANLVKTVIEQLDVQVLNEHAMNGQVNVLEIGCGLGQSAIDAVHTLGSNVNVTGVSVTPGHVVCANKLAASAGLSSNITHHLCSAAQIDTLQSAPFSGAYSCEVFSEIPDDDLRVSFAALRNMLPPGAEFSYADIVKTEDTPSHANSTRRFYPRDGPSTSLWTPVAPMAAAMMWGGDWRPASRFNALLTEAGFEIVSMEFIGDRVFVPTWEYVRKRIKKQPRMGMNSSFKGWLARTLTTSSLGGLSSLWEHGQVDYVLVKARRL